jgi:uncharacterized cupredoxin-like copper-binding protein
LAPAVALVPAVVAAAACGGKTTSQSVQTLRVTQKDFAISAAPKRLHAGKVRLVAHNDGPDTHELLLVRADGGRLPLRSDGLTVDEEALQSRLVTTIEGYAPHTQRDVVVDLKPGRYTLFCNMAGHYLGGMHRQLVVG